MGVPGDLGLFQVIKVTFRKVSMKKVFINILGPTCGFQEHYRGSLCIRGSFRALQGFSVSCMAFQGTTGRCRRFKNIQKDLKRFQNNAKGVSRDSGRFQGCFRGLRGELS